MVYANPKDGAIPCPCRNPYPSPFRHKYLYRRRRDHSYRNTCWYRKDQNKQHLPSVCGTYVFWMHKHNRDNRLLNSRHILDRLLIFQFPDHHLQKDWGHNSHLDHPASAGFDPDRKQIDFDSLLKALHKHHHHRCLPAYMKSRIEPSWR